MKIVALLVSVLIGAASFAADPAAPAANPANPAPADPGMKKEDSMKKDDAMAAKHDKKGHGKKKHGATN